MSDDILYKKKIKHPFVALPKVCRFLSYYDVEGDKRIRKRLTSNDITVLAYYMELDENFKSNEMGALECNIKLTAFKKSKSILQKEMIEIGCPLIHVSNWRDEDGYKHATVEFCASQRALGQYFDELYDEENGKSRRNHWLSLWNPELIEELITKSNKRYQGQHTTQAPLERRSTYDPGEGRYTTYKETKNENETKKNERNEKEESFVRFSSKKIFTPDCLKNLPLSDSDKLRFAERWREDPGRMEEAVKAFHQQNPENPGAWLNSAWLKGFTPATARNKSPEQKRQWAKDFLEKQALPSFCKYEFRPSFLEMQINSYIYEMAFEDKNFEKDVQELITRIHGHAKKI